jgi:DMSO reductase anchor subunit
MDNPTAWEPPDLQMEEWSDTFTPQREWGVGRGGWVSNSTYLLIALFLGGVGSGAALIALALERANSDWYFIAGYIVGVGGKGFFHIMFLGNPLRGWRAVSRWRSSWISRGIIALNLFAVAGGLYILGPIAGVFGEVGVGEERALFITCVALLGILVVYDGFLLSESAAIGAWNMALMILLFPIFSLLGGAGLLGALWGPIHSDTPGKSGYLDLEALHELETILLAAGAFALASYLLTIHRDHFLRESAWKSIVGPLRPLFIVAVVIGAVALPLVVAAMSLSWPLIEDATILLAIVALVAVVGDYAFKYIVLSVGGFSQQFAPGPGQWSTAPTDFTMRIQPAGKSPGFGL